MWRVIALQKLVVFCQTSTRINHRYTYAFLSFCPPSLFPSLYPSLFPSSLPSFIFKKTVTELLQYIHSSTNLRDKNNPYLPGAWILLLVLSMNWLLEKCCKYMNLNTKKRVRNLIAALIKSQNNIHNFNWKHLWQSVHELIIIENQLLKQNKGNFLTFSTDNICNTYLSFFFQFKYTQHHSICKF